MKPRLTGGGGGGGGACGGCILKILLMCQVLGTMVYVTYVP